MRRHLKIVLCSVFAVVALPAAAHAGWLDGLQDDGPGYFDPGDRTPIAAPPARTHRQPHERAPLVAQPAASVEILWGGSWYEGTVLDRRGAQYYVHYSGYADSWNEWVGPDRIRFTRTPPRPSRVTSVQILWGGQWYPGRVLDQRGGRYLIHYDGYGDSWNEWVGPDRLRFPERPRRHRNR